MKMKMQIQETELANQIINALSTAFGGRSQWGHEEMGRAIWGWHNNNGMKSPLTMIELISKMEKDFWGWEEYQKEDFEKGVLFSFDKRQNE